MTADASASPPRLDPLCNTRFGRWLAARQRLVIGLLIGVSVLVRVVYFAQLAGGPCAVLHRHLQTDMNFFDQWARRIAGGDWLSDAPLHPLHRWHLAAAEAYFAENPGKIAEFTGLPGVDDAVFTPAEALWNHWYGGPKFHQEPLYPYLIAVTYRLFGDDVRGVFAWQLAVGVLTNLLVYLIARRHFGPVVAALAGILVAASGPLLFFEMVLLRTSLEVFAAVGLVWLLDRARERAAPGAWIVAGLALGAAVLLKMTFLLFWAGAVALAAWEHRRQPRRCLPVVGWLTAGLTISLMPAVARNLAVGAPPLALSSVGPVTFVGANVAGAPVDGGFHSATEQLPGIMGPTDGRFLPVVWRTLATHDGVGSVLGHQLRKLAVAWHGFEIPNNANLYVYRSYAWILGALPVGFAVIGPLALLGLGLDAAARRRFTTLHLLLVSSLLPLVAFYVLARFRAPMMAGLIPFAAYALARLLQTLADRRWASAAGIVGGVLAVGAWTWWPLGAERSPTTRADYEGLYQAYYQAAHEEPAVRGDWLAAAAALARFCDHMPPPLQQPDLRPPLDRDTARVAEFFAQIWDARSKYLAAAGRTGESAACAARAAALLGAAR